MLIRCVRTLEPTMLRTLLPYKLGLLLKISSCLWILVVLISVSHSSPSSWNPS